MTRTRLRPALVLAPLLTAATASAQAPGQFAAPPPAEPPAAAAPAFASRWSVALGLGSLRVVDGMTDAEASFDIVQAALRFRAGRHLELELSGGGGDERLADGSQGTLAVATATLAVRYRFSPERDWNWWLLAGVGGTTIAPKDSTEDVVDQAQRPHGVLGVGVEKRWGRFALQGELRAYALGPTQAEVDLAEATGTDPVSEVTGAHGALTAAYYF